MDEIVRLETAVAVGGLLALAVVAAVFALLLRRFHRQLGRGYLRAWGLAWVAVAVAALGEAWLTATAGAAAAPGRLLAATAHEVGGYWHAAWMLFGTVAIATGRPVSRRGGQAILGALALLGLAAVAPASSPAGALRDALLAGLLGGTLLLAGALLGWVARRTTISTGPAFVSAAFGASGAAHLVLSAAALGWIAAPPIWLLSPVRLLLGALLGLATVVWLLEDEQHRLRDASRQIERFAYYDVLTGVANRRLFVDRLRQWLQRAQREGSSGALFFLDLDHFQRVNDELGHDAGDQALAAVADRLLHSVREGDVVARVGGDEFTILLPGVADARRAAQIADELLERLRQPLRVGDSDRVVPASVGVALAPADGTDAAVLLRKADSAMHRAKDLGRGAAVIYDDALADTARERFALETALREGRLEQHLELHYQPIVQAGSGEIVGAEALVRWRHPQRGLLLPSEFLFAAESTAVSEAISRWVLDTACRTMAGWRSRHSADLRVAVNLSARAIEHHQLTAMVDRALELSGLPPAALELEITETMALLQAADPAPILAELRARGIRVAVDDFGTGYSSLSYLRELPVEIVKLDSSFIRDLGRRPQDARIVGAVIQLAHGLGMEVVAEGVEGEEQMALLEMLACDRMQGYLFSRPLSAPDFEALLESARPFRGLPAHAAARLVH